MKSKLAAIWAWLGRRPLGFALPDRTLPQVRVRALRPEDVAACLEIYRLNEPGRFPENCLPEFEKAMAEETNRFIVVVEGDAVVGVGGLEFRNVLLGHDCGMIFGMVHPAQQKRGIGTVLVLARMAMLTEPRIMWKVTCLPVPLAESFYASLGFAHVADIVTKRQAQAEKVQVVCLRRDDWKKCRLKLAEAKIELDVPSVTPIPSLPNRGLSAGPFPM